MIKKSIYFIVSFWAFCSLAMERDWEYKFEKAWGHKEAIEKVIQELVAQGNNVNFTFNGGRATPLAVAVLHKDKEAIKLLLDKGAYINMPTAQGMTPLHFAVTTENPSMVSYLLELGADPTAKTIAGLTPLIIAERNDLHTIADILSKALVCPAQEKQATPLLRKNEIGNEYGTLNPRVKVEDKQRKRTVIKQRLRVMLLALKSRNYYSFGLKAVLEVYSVKDSRRIRIAINKGNLRGKRVHP